MVERDVVLPGGVDSISEVTELTDRAEQLGFHRVSLPEVNGRDAVSLLGMLAERTDDIGLSNDVFSPWGRSPAILAQTGITLQELSDGRYRMGLGTSSPALTERWHLASYDRPLRRLRETIELVRQIARGDRIDYDGECYAGSGLRLQGGEPGEFPIDVAALGPKTVELAGRFADGWVPQLFTPSALEDRMDDLRRGASLGERDPDEVRVALTVRSCAMEDAERARGVAARQIAFMVGAYGPYYRQSIARQGFESETDAIHAAWEEGDRGEAVAAVTDEMVDELVAAGTPNEVRETFERFEAVDGVDALRVGFFGEMTAELRTQTIEVLSPQE